MKSARRTRGRPPREVWPHSQGYVEAMDTMTDVEAVRKHIEASGDAIEAQRRTVAMGDAATGMPRAILEARRARAEEAEAAICDACSRLDAMGMHREAEVVALRYASGMQWKQVATAIGYSQTRARAFGVRAIEALATRTNTSPIA